MKKSTSWALGLTLLCILFNVQFIKAQVPNGDFEYWTSKSSTAPENWSVLGSISKTTGSAGGNAIKLSNNANEGTFSMAMQVAFDTGAFYASRFAYAATPDSITIVYKALLGQDTCSIAIAFTKSGQDFPIAYSDIQLMGNSGNWITKTFAIEYINPTPSLVADSGYVIISTADEVDGPLSSGSIEIDKLTFKFANNSAAPNIPNHSFENWHTNAVEYPNDWVTLPLMLAEQGVKLNTTAKTSDKFNGNYALELAPFIATNPETGFDDTFPGAAVTNKPGRPALQADIYTPSFPINQRYTSFRGRYKSTLEKGDIVVVWVTIFDADSLVGSVYFTDNANHNNFIEFSENITWDTTFTGIPDSATVALYLTDTAINSIGSLNSRAMFDYLRFDNWTTGVETDKILKSCISPNPAKGETYLKINSTMATPIELVLYNSTGSVVKQINQTINAGKSNIHLDLNEQPVGIYMLKLVAGNQTSTHKIILTQ